MPKRVFDMWLESLRSFYTLVLRKIAAFYVANFLRLRFMITIKVNVSMFTNWKKFHYTLRYKDVINWVVLLGLDSWSKNIHSITSVISRIIKGINCLILKIDKKITHHFLPFKPYIDLLKERTLYILLLVYAHMNIL